MTSAFISRPHSVYLVIATACYIGFGWRYVLVALGWFNVCIPGKKLLPAFLTPCAQEPWPFVMPPVAFLMTFILAAVLCMAVSAMGGFQLYLVANGETSVENQDHEQSPTRCGGQQAAQESQHVQGRGNLED